VTEDEEVRFRATLKRGLKILDERFDEMKTRNENVLSGAAAADLYTTYGFPLDLTQVICAENGHGVDVDGAEKIIHGADEADGPIDPNAAVDHAYRDARAKLSAPVVFTGYDHESGSSEVVAIIAVESGESQDKPKRSLVEKAGAGQSVEVIVSKTPFYAESGGQVGDSGIISGDDGLRIRVTDVQKPLAGLYVHIGVVEAGEIKVGGPVKLDVDHQARSATRRNHSATHLLHWALRTVLGEHAQQKGSRVGPDMLRFDFAHNKPLTREEMDKVPLTLSLTMTIGEWRQVSNQLSAMPNAWPSCDVKFAILRRCSCPSGKATA